MILVSGPDAIADPGSLPIDPTSPIAVASVADWQTEPRTNDSAISSLNLQTVPTKALPTVLRQRDGNSDGILVLHLTGTLLLERGRVVVHRATASDPNQRPLDWLQLLDAIGDHPAEVKLITLDLLPEFVLPTPFRLPDPIFPSVVNSVEASEDPHLWVLVAHSIGETPRLARDCRQTVFGKAVRAAFGPAGDRDLDGELELGEFVRTVAGTVVSQTRGSNPQHPILLHGGGILPKTDPQLRLMTVGSQLAADSESPSAGDDSGEKPQIRFPRSLLSLPPEDDQRAGESGISPDLTPALVRLPRQSPPPPPKTAAKSKPEPTGADGDGGSGASSVAERIASLWRRIGSLSASSHPSDLLTRSPQLLRMVEAKLVVLEWLYLTTSEPESDGFTVGLGRLERLADLLEKPDQGTQPSDSALGLRIAAVLGKPPGSGQLPLSLADAVRLDRDGSRDLSDQEREWITGFHQALRDPKDSAIRSFSQELSVVADGYLELRLLRRLSETSRVTDSQMRELVGAAAYLLRLSTAVGSYPHWHSEALGEAFDDLDRARVLIEEGIDSNADRDASRLIERAFRNLDAIAARIGELREISGELREFEYRLPNLVAAFAAQSPNSRTVRELTRILSEAVQHGEWVRESLHPSAENDWPELRTRTNRFRETIKRLRTATNHWIAAVLQDAAITDRPCPNDAVPLLSSAILSAEQRIELLVNLSQVPTEQKQPLTPSGWRTVRSEPPRVLTMARRQHYIPTVSLMKTIDGLITRPPTGQGSSPIEIESLEQVLGTPSSFWRIYRQHAENLGERSIELTAQLRETITPGIQLKTEALLDQWTLRWNNRATLMRVVGAPLIPLGDLQSPENLLWQASRYWYLKSVLDRQQLAWGDKSLLRLETTVRSDISLLSSTPSLSMRTAPSVLLSVEQLRPFDSEGRSNLRITLENNSEVSQNLKVTANFDTSALRVTREDRSNRAAVFPNDIVPVVVPPGETVRLDWKVTHLDDGASEPGFVVETEGTDRKLRKTISLRNRPPTDFDLVVKDASGGAKAVSVENGLIDLRPFPGRDTAYQSSLRNLRPSKTAAELSLRTVRSPFPEGEFPTSVSLSRASELFGELGVSEPLFPALPLAFDGSGAAVPVTWPKPTPDQLMTRLGARLLIVVEDSQANRATLFPVSISPQRPRRYLQPTVDFLGTKQEVRVRLKAAESVPVPGAEVTVRVTEPKGLAIPPQQTVVPPGQLRELVISLPGDIGPVAELAIDVDGFPRAFLFRIPPTGDQFAIEEWVGRRRIRVDRPAGDNAVGPEQSQVRCRVQVDAPVGSFRDKGDRVLVGWDLDRDRTVASLNRATLFTDRDAMIRFAPKPPSGALGISCEISDWNVAVGREQLVNGSFGLRAVLVLGDSRLPSRSQPVLIDSRPPQITKPRLKTVVAGTDLVIPLSVSDLAGSGVASVEAGVVPLGVTKLPEDPPPLTAIASPSGQWLVTIPAAQLAAGPQGLIVRATDRAGNRVTTEPIVLRAVSQKTVEAERQAVTATVSGKILFGSRPAAGTIITLKPKGGATPDGSTTEIPPATADSRGLFRLVQVPPGDYELTARHPSLFNKPRSLSQPLVVDSPNPPPLDLQLSQVLRGNPKSTD